MKAIYDIKTDMKMVKRTLEVIETEANGKDFTVRDLCDKKGGYMISGASMNALIRRGLIKKVGECPSSYKREVYVDRRVGYVEVDIPTTVKVYRQIHDYEWYKNVMLKTLTNAVMSV